MNEKFVSVTSLCKNPVVFAAPEYHYERTWPKYGAKLLIDRDILANSIYRIGVERLFTQGFLYIEDEDFRKQLGLEYVTEVKEDDGLDGIKKILVLDDKMITRIIKLMPISEVKITLQQLSSNQKLELADYAVNHSADLKMDRVDLLSQECGINILKAIEMKKALEV